MNRNRRALLTGLGGLSAAAAFRNLEAQVAPAPGALAANARNAVPGFPRRADFAIEEGYTYISGAFTHPMPIAAAEAYRDAVNRRGTIGTPAGASRSPAPPRTARADPKTAFAALLNAKPSEISDVPDRALGLQRHARRGTPAERAVLIAL